MTKVLVGKFQICYRLLIAKKLEYWDEMVRCGNLIGMYEDEDRKIEIEIGIALEMVKRLSLNSSRGPGTCQTIRKDAL